MKNMLGLGEFFNSIGNVILTGVSFHENQIGAACIGEDRKPQYYP